MRIVQTMRKLVFKCMKYPLETGNFGFPKNSNREKKVGCLFRVNTIYDQPGKPANVILINSLHFLQIPGHISGFQSKTIIVLNCIKIAVSLYSSNFQKKKFLSRKQKKSSIKVPIVSLFHSDIGNN